MENVLATRVAYSVAQADGFVENLIPGVDDPSSVDDWAARLSTTCKVSEEVEVILRLAASESTPTGYDVLADNIGFDDWGLGFTTGYTREGLSFFENEADHQGEQPVREQERVATRDLGRTRYVTLTSVTAYDWGTWIADADEDGSPFDFLNVVPDSEAEAWSQDLRLASSGTGQLNCWSYCLPTVTSSKAGSIAGSSTSMRTRSTGFRVASSISSPVACTRTGCCRSAKAMRLTVS